MSRNATAVPAIRFTDREAVRLISDAAELTGEPLAKVAARSIILYFATRKSDRQRTLNLIPNPETKGGVARLLAKADGHKA